jgi:hypothetical protein
MSFKRLDPEDFLVSIDSVTATAWSTNNPTLTSFFTSSTTSTNDNYYKNVYQTGSTLSGSAVQFAIAYGNRLGSGSINYNDSVPGVTTTRTVYGQYRNLIYGSETAEFIFGTVTASDFWAINVDRARYKEHLLKGTFNLKLSGSYNLQLTDNSGMVSTDTYLDCGRVYQIISGSNGTAYSGTGYSPSSGSYGLFLPDIATIILNPLALSSPTASGGIGFAYSGSSSSGSLTYSSATNANAQLYRAISASANFYLNSQESITSDYVFVRPRSAEFNYSENPSFISGSTGEVLYSNFINNPQVYITTIGLYNDTNQLLAVAKLSRPLLKDFTKEALVRVKLDF